MEVSLVGLGCGTPATMTLAGRDAVMAADCLIGGVRVLESVASISAAPCHAATRADEILSLLEGGNWQHPCVVFSGDTGFYSGAKPLLPLLRQGGHKVTVLPGISSVQMLAARLERPWQDWRLVSAHGTDCNPLAALLAQQPVCFLTGGRLDPAALCRQMTRAGLGDLPVIVGERLSYETERIRHGVAANFAEEHFDTLSILLAEASTRPYAPRSPGFPDDMFLREKGTPMTKQEVRAAALAKLAVRPGDVLWDIGAGTGSVAVELALAAPQGHTWAVECDRAAFALLEKNRQHFGAWNLTGILGTAPEVCAALPSPDGVFIGGSKGALAEIVATALEKNSAARLCISAIALETLGAAVSALAANGIEAEVSQIAVSRSKAAGGLHLLLANNPIFLISGQKRGE